MKFVDKIEATARLKDALAREKSTVAVMYGRRRLGKSQKTLDVKILNK